MGLIKRFLDFCGEESRSVRIYAPDYRENAVRRNNNVNKPPNPTMRNYGQRTRLSQAEYPSDVYAPSSRRSHAPPRKSVEFFDENAERKSVGNGNSFFLNNVPSAVKKTAPSDKAVYESPSNINMYYPRSFDDIIRLVDSLKFKEAVIVELCYLPDSLSQKMLDFMSGAMYALGGGMQRINGSTFLFTPPFVKVNTAKCR
ncbi:MAG: cell division protein SepF [Clostridiales bacterium]|jgi:FtsZ-interacting cell division protein YlmF|nr:cell division protein SepF [Clostridiales bacterium]